MAFGDSGDLVQNNPVPQNAPRADSPALLWAIHLHSTRYCTIIRPGLGSRMFTLTFGHFFDPATKTPVIRASIDLRFMILLLLSLGGLNLHFRVKDPNQRPEPAVAFHCQKPQESPIPETCLILVFEIALIRSTLATNTDG
jgi:hypothetical protein